MPNISISEGNHQTLQFRQLIEYNMRYIFLEELCTKCGAETSTTLFCKKPKMIISRDKQSEVLRSFFFFFFCMSKSRTTKVYWHLGTGHLVLLRMNLFKITKCLKLVSLSHFSAWNDIGQYLYCNCFFLILWRHKLWN